METSKNTSRTTAFMVVGLTALLAFFAWLSLGVISLGNKDVELSEKLNDYGDDFNKLEVSMKENFDRLETSIKDISNQISGLKETMIGFHNTRTARRSPLALTEEGKKLAEKLSSEKFITEKWDTINFKVRSYLGVRRGDSSSLSDIQRACFFVAEDYGSIFPKKEKKMIDLIIFEEGVPDFFITSVFGIQIRDIYFKENKLQ